MGKNIVEQIALLVPATVYVDFQDVRQVLDKAGWMLAPFIQAGEVEIGRHVTTVYYPYRSKAIAAKDAVEASTLTADEEPLIVNNGQVAVMWRRMIADDWKSVEFVPHLSLSNLEVAKIILDLAGVAPQTFLLETETVRLPIPEWVALSGFGMVTERITVEEAKQKVLQFVLVLAKVGLLPDQLAMLLVEAK